MKKEILLIICLFVCFVSRSQEPETKWQAIDYKTYIELVWKQNLNYAAEKLNVSIAEAELKAAKVFNNPNLSVAYADNDERRMQMGRSVSVELGKTFSIGKRQAGINLAKSEKELNEALLTDYFHRLRAEATLAYFEALKQKELYYIKDYSCTNLRRLAESDSIRFSLGKITESDYIQSRIEAEAATNELLTVRAEMYNAYASLNVWTGVFSQDALYDPAGKLQAIEKPFNSGELLETALNNRADLAAALKNVDVSKKQLKVIRRERNMDFDFALGYNYNTEVRNEIAPAPKFNGVTAGISIPLKFSNLNKGAVQAAELRRQQAEVNYRQAELEVQNSVMQSLRNYISFVEQVKNYENGLLERVETVLAAKIYSYKRGETSRLEVLVAQQSYNERQTAYIETVFNSIAALIELERNVGVWDIEVE
ncbi:MAG: TolC family protein [Dysgonamonadaceae bacterium]|jgi:cobalt-zinc-cadmium efflux system outer membrane protein|nr:TolC family protein [Dysgonamonadaceae bacterium]